MGKTFPIPSLAGLTPFSIRLELPYGQALSAHAMRLVAVSPCFDPHAPDGASRFTGQLALALGSAGITGRWFTTTASGAVPTSALSNQWPPAFSAEELDIGALRLTRLSARDPLPRLVWKIATRLLLGKMRPRLDRARERARAVGPQAWLDVAWPSWAEAYVLAAQGPHMPGFGAAFRETLEDSDVALVAYPPLGLASHACDEATRASRKTALITLFHGEDPLNSLPVWVRHYQRAAAILALTESEAVTFRDLFHHPNVHVIGAGIDPADLHSQTISGQRFRAAHHLGDRPFALYLGRKELGKKYGMAIEAVRLAQTLHPAASDLQLVMIGADVDQQPVRSNDALYLGPLPRHEVLDALDACTILINPSTSESFGLTLLEAWSRSKPVIANADCAPFRAIVTDGINGWLASDVAGMATRLAEVVAQPSVGRRLGEAGAAHVKRTYSWAAVADRTLAALESIAPTRSMPTT